MTYEFAKKIGIEYPSEWDTHGKASWDWYNAFMHLHRSLSLRTPEQTSAHRSKALSEVNVKAFFDNFDVVMFQRGITFEPHRIWNMDETGCPTVPTKTVPVIALKGARRVGQKTSAERGTNVSMALAVNATGLSIPPFYIFPRKNMQSVFMDNASPGAVGVANDSGWMTSREFVKYMEHFIKHSNASKNSPTLLLLDNHNSHLSVEAIQMAIDNGITMLSFPPHCSHRMQPLDVSVFGPFKKMFFNQCQFWMKNHIGKVLELKHIVPIADKCLDVCATPKNIKSGFRAAGIYPFDPYVFTAEDYEASELSGENQTSGDDNDNCRILLFGADVIEPATYEEVVTSTSEASSVLSDPSTTGASISSVIKDVSPLKHDIPMKRSKRGRKAMGSTILTSPENVANLCQKKGGKKKIDDENKKTVRASPAKRSCLSTRTKKISSASDFEEDFCIICMGTMPRKLNRINSIHCKTCDRAVHLKCANLKDGQYTCIHCISE